MEGAPERDRKGTGKTPGEKRAQKNVRAGSPGRGGGGGGAGARDELLEPLALAGRAGRLAARGHERFEASPTVGACVFEERHNLRSQGFRTGPEVTGHPSGPCWVSHHMAAPAGRTWSNG